MIKVGFELEMDEGVEAPSSGTVVQALSEALPKEWWAEVREDNWGVKALFALDDDGRPLASDLRFREKSMDMLRAELVQERKLTTSLDAEVGRMELAVNNLTEKNDNQTEIIQGMQRKTKAWTVQDNDSNATIRRLKGELLNANVEAQNHAEMIRKIVDAMESTGYDIGGGWGNDEELEELETTAGGVKSYLDDASSEIQILNDQLDTIRTRR